MKVSSNKETNSYYYREEKYFMKAHLSGTTVPLASNIKGVTADSDSVFILLRGGIACRLFHRAVRLRYVKMKSSSA